MGISEVEYDAPNVAAGFELMGLLPQSKEVNMKQFLKSLGNNNAHSANANSFKFQVHNQGSLISVNQP